MRDALVHLRLQLVELGQCQIFRVFRIDDGAQELQTFHRPPRAPPSAPLAFFHHEFHPQIGELHQRLHQPSPLFVRHEIGHLPVELGWYG